MRRAHSRINCYRAESISAHSARKGEDGDFRLPCSASRFPKSISAPQAPLQRVRASPVKAPSGAALRSATRIAICRYRREMPSKRERGGAGGCQREKTYFKSARAIDWKDVRARACLLPLGFAALGLPVSFSLRGFSLSRSLSRALGLFQPRGLFN